MNAKQTTVALCQKNTGVTQEFEITHAERILRLRNNGGWELPESSNYIFDLQNGITKKRNKGKDKGAEEKRND